MSSRRKTNKILTVILLNLILIVSFYLIGQEQTFKHEMTHLTIAQNYGCVDYKIKVDTNSGGEFECTEYKTNVYNESEMRLHTLNEIIAYNMSSLFSMIQVSVIIILNSIFYVALFANNIYKK